ncbi:hypothetical protein HDU88_000531 [Geranomyces variabilis]|nr:hypothetical protein HDU88_000531 [Geranomyces variabilis]
MGNVGSSQTAANKPSFSIEAVGLQTGPDTAPTTLKLSGGDVLEITAPGGIGCDLKLSSLLNDPDSSTPTQWKSVQSLARLSEAGCQRLRGRDLTLTIDYSEDLVAEFSFAVVGELPKGLVFIATDDSAERQNLMSKGSEFSSNISRFPNVLVPQLVPSEPAHDGITRYSWNWKYAPPVPSGNGTARRELLPPTGGWKTFCCFGEYIPETKHFSAIMVFEFFVSSVVSPVARQSSQASALGSTDAGGGRRTSLLGALDFSPLSLHTDNAESALSPRSARSSLSSPQSNPPFLGQGSGPPSASFTHRREHSGHSATSITNLEEVDDEPAFRATLESLERKTNALKLSVKQTNKELLAYIVAGRAFVEARRVMNEAIADIPIIDAAVPQMLREVASAADYQIDKMLLHVEGVVLVQTNGVYADIKKVESKKKVYEQETKEFNSYEQKYLSMRGQKQKLSEADQKFQEKKKNYELTRLDYYVDLRKLHGAYSEGILDMEFTGLARKQLLMYEKIHEKLATKNDALAALEKRWKEVAEKSNVENRVGEERRKLIESKAQLYHEAGQAAVAANEGSHSDPEEDPAMANKFKGYRDLAQTDSDSVAMGRRRKGYLWVAAANDKVPHGQPKGNPGQMNWKKMWCVLQKGTLREYNLKRNQQEETYTTNLRLCTIRDSRNVDRRFSFELISGTGGKFTKRVYQATDAADVKAWMSVIQNSIEGALNGTVTMSGDSGPEFGVGPSSMGPSSEMVWGTAEEDGFGGAPGTLRALDVLRDADPANSACAECSGKNPDWISINLGCLLCIDCSGSHRKLGTHITKIRSLTLDQSWTPELLSMLRALGNTRSNSIWEAILPNPDLKPTVRDPREHKERFIRDKYVSGAYLDRASESDPQALLLRAAASRDVPEMLRAVALGADLSVTPVGCHPVVIVALGYPSAPAPPPPRRESSIPLLSPIANTTATGFPPPPPAALTYSGNPRLMAAEFVLQNGANINAVTTLPWGTTDPAAPPAQMAAIHFAATLLDVDALTFLITKGADLTLKDAAGNTPLNLVETSAGPTTRSAASSAKLPDLPPLPDGGDGAITVDAATICADKLRTALAKLSSYNM